MGANYNAVVFKGYVEDGRLDKAKQWATERGLNTEEQLDLAVAVKKAYLGLNATQYLQRQLTRLLSLYRPKIHCLQYTMV